MYAKNAYDTYAQNNVGIESPTKLVEMLYEGVLKFNTLAKTSIEAGDIKKKTYYTNRSITIINELVSVLDFSQGDVAKYLEGLYNYQLGLLMEANLHDDTTKVDECTNVFKGLLEAWRESTHVA